MSTFKRAKVVMLATEKAEDCLYTSSNKLSYHKGYLTQDYLKNSLNGKSYHLYLISDDEIKEGDWVYDSSSLPQDAPIKRIRIIDNTHYTLYDDTSRNLKHHYKKIIATTDKSLEIMMSNPAAWDAGIKTMSLPQPSQSFIEKYVEEYNKGNVITDVLVEYDPIRVEVKTGAFKTSINRPTIWETEMKTVGYNIKTREDNTVIIHQAKMYTREEVHNLMMQAWIWGQSKPDCHYTVREKWIEENL